LSSCSLTWQRFALLCGPNLARQQHPRLPSVYQHLQLALLAVQPLVELRRQQGWG